jgi:hypothetical protein
MNIEMHRRWLPFGGVPSTGIGVAARAGRGRDWCGGQCRGAYRRGGRWRWAGAGVLLALAACVSGSASGESPQLRLPPWESLEFEKRAFGLLALSHVEMGVDPLDARYWTLSAASSLAGNTELVQLRMAPDSGRLLEQTRLTEGRDSRLKIYRYLPDRMVRERREPAGNAELPPEQWPVSSTLESPYPAGEAGTLLTASYGMLAVADSFYREGSSTADLLVHADFSFYHLRLKRRRGPKVEVDYLIAGSGERVQGRHPTVAIKLRAKALNKTADPQDYELLGLRGDIDILFDTRSGLPVRLTGDAPRIGSSSIDLRGVSFREGRE